MNPVEMTTVLKFLISKLPENELAELDALLAGEDRASNLAQDSARQRWLDLGPVSRRAIRNSRQTNLAKDAAARDAVLTDFPHFNRMG